MDGNPEIAVDAAPPASRRVNVSVRPATQDDVPAILDIYNEAGVATPASADVVPQTVEQRRAWLEEHDRDGYAVLVAEDSTGRVVGWASLSAYHRRYGYRFTAEDSVYVKPDMCGRGVGGELLPRLIAAARLRGLHAIVASIGGDNEPSVRLHARCGFEHVGILRQAIHKFDRWQDIVYMELILD